MPVNSQPLFADFNLIVTGSGARFLFGACIMPVGVVNIHSAHVVTMVQDGWSIA